MRLLVLGGTVFLGHAVAAEAVRRGHQVCCAARGSSGTPPEGAELVRIDRDRRDGLAALEHRRFDAAVDVATMSHTWVAAALAALAGRVGHWSFVSTVNVYADTATRGQRADAPLLPPRAEHHDLAGGPPTDPEHYGAIKVASENAVREATGGRAFIVRPGTIVGTGDGSDRFGYWPARFARGGDVLVPDVPEQPSQYLDVRDLAGWLVDAGEQRIAGSYDGVGEIRPLPELLAEIAALARPDGAVRLTPVAERVLTEAKVTPWSGPRSLPLWLPRSHHGVTSHDPAPSLAAGLRLRPLAETVADALAEEHRRGPDRERKAGLSATEEAEVLATLA
jgi:2'-hydroxyisoflavone reductase